MIYSESFPVEGFLLQVKAPHHTTPHHTRGSKNPQYISFSRDAENPQKKA
jgi:hypothetical protein